MKYSAFITLAAMAAVSFTSCGNGDGESEANADTMTLETPVDGMANEITFYDLNTGKELHRESSGSYVDESGSPSQFYVDVQARDTFEASTGRKTNNAMVRINNTWSLDEAKMTLTDNKMVIEDEDSKLKVKENKAKLITEDKKVKVKDVDGDGVNEVKVKDR